ncbi:hypothetical protein Hanom_Chr08g00757641 [Helianthus anomalus]
MERESCVVYEMNMCVCLCVLQSNHNSFLPSLLFLKCFFLDKQVFFCYLIV